MLRRNLTSIISLVLVICMIASMLCSCRILGNLGDGIGDAIDDAIGGNGLMPASKVAMSMNGIEVDAAMMNFFYNDYLTTWLISYRSHIGNYIHLDPNTDLKSQQYGTGMETYFFGEYDGTWYDFFLDATLENVQMYLIYASGAQKSGLSLSAEDEAEIDEQINTINDTLKDENTSLAEKYGYGVNEKVVRRCYELIYLSSAYADKLYDDLADYLDSNPDVTSNYRDDHKEDFYSADYISYTITITESIVSSDVNDYENDLTEAREAINKIGSAAGPAEFFVLIEAYEGDFVSGPAPSLETKIEASKRTQRYSIDTDEYGNTVDSLNNWLFLDGAAENETRVFEEKSTSAVGTEMTKFTAYMVIDPMHYDTSYTKSIGYILTSQKQAIHEFQKAFSAQPDKNTYAFYSLASEQREKYDDNEVFYYDISEYATDNYFSVDYDALNQWLDGGDLVDNSLSDIIEITVNNETYYALVYFERYNGAVWYVDARGACITSLTEEWYESELSSGDLFRDNDVMYGIDVAVFKEGVTE